jgi:hypothetical protein
MPCAYNFHSQFPKLSEQLGTVFHIFLVSVWLNLLIVLGFPMLEGVAPGVIARQIASPCRISKATR